MKDLRIQSGAPSSASGVHSEPHFLCLSNESDLWNLLSAEVKDPLYGSLLP